MWRLRQSPLIRVMVWRRHVTSHYMNQIGQMVYDTLPGSAILGPLSLSYNIVVMQVHVIYDYYFQHIEYLIINNFSHSGAYNDPLRDITGPWLPRGRISAVFAISVMRNVNLCLCFLKQIQEIKVKKYFHRIWHNPHNEELWKYKNLLLDIHHEHCHEC